MRSYLLPPLIKSTRGSGTSQTKNETVLLLCYIGDGVPFPLWHQVFTDSVCQYKRHELSYLPDNQPVDEELLANALLDLFDQVKQ